MKRRYNSFSVRSCSDVSSGQVSGRSTPSEDQRRAFTVQKQDYVLPESLVCAAVSRENLDHFIGRRHWHLTISRVVCNDHELLVENKL